MESLARPPHRRKHSTATNAVSFKNPYDEVLLSNGGKRNSFEAHEYAEIFSGSSSIPVLDLSGLDERARSGDCRGSKLDYSNIFGGLRNDDVAVPYEELFNGSAKKSKTRTSRIPADVRLPLQESGSLHSSGRTRSPGEASDQSIDGVKQQFNMSFNRTSQRNIDASNGKTHVARLHAVSGFTYFVDENLQQKTEDGRPVPSLKHEVSRTWSFSADVEAVKGKGGLSCDKLHVDDKSQNGNGDSLKSHFAKVPPSSLRPSDGSDDKTPSRSSAPNFASKQDFASKEIAGERSPPFSDEEYDENSVAALSAAALKKAIDQAQESIRIAKMIMERKKEGYENGSKPRSRDRTQVLGKEAQIVREAYVPKENNAREKYEVKDPIFTGTDAKVTLPHSHNDTLVDARNTEVDRVRVNVEAAKDHGEVFGRGGNLFAPNCNQSETLYVDEKVELKKLGENVEKAETHGDATYYPGLVANAECKTANLKSEKVGYNNSLMLSMSKLAYHLGGLITGKERKEITVNHTKEPEVRAELLEKAPNTSQRKQKQAKSVEEAERRPVTFDYVEGPESRVERVLSTSQKTREQEKIVGEHCENLRIIQDNEVTEERYSDADDKGKLEKKFEEHEEWLDAENLTVPRSEFDYSPNESRNLVGSEMVEPDEMMKITESVSEWKENGLRQGKTCAEENGEHPCSESKEKLKEVLEEDNNGREPDIFPEIGEDEKIVNEVYEPEIDVRKQKQNHTHDIDEPELAGELDQNKVEERNMNTSAYDAAENIVMEGNNYEVLNSAASGNSEGTNNTLRGAEISEENHNKCEFEEAAYEEDISDAVNVNSSDASAIFNDDHANDTGTIFSEAEEAYDVDLNSKAEEYQKSVTSYKDNDAVPEATGIFSATDKNEEAERVFTLEDSEVPGMDSLHRSASEEFFVESKLHNAFEGLFPDGKTENVGIMDAEPQDKLREDEYAFKSTNEILDAAQKYYAKINGQNLPEVRTSDITAQIDLTDVRQVLEQISELDEGSVSTSSFENIDEFSALESVECAENTKNKNSDKNSDKEELKVELGMVSSGRKSSDEQSEGMYSLLHTEPNEMEKSMETERPVERGVNLEKNKEELIGTLPMEERDAKAGVQNTSRNDYQQRIEAIKREREREKDRLAVERAIREARERAFAEARDRAERAAVERAAAEVRQRVIAEAREKLGKASGGKQQADKASTEAKLRAERAAVERATAEARERALEKAMSQKTYTEGRTQADRYPSEKFSSTSRNNGLKHSFSSSDLENGMNTESAQRRKARLERHQRIMERAAKALEEKNMRDLLAQKEQAERNRLADSLDADIKRWATGKEGNLRALLSTLQYILGPDSGWKPISLTEIITTAAVKKAYRKATLYVHPDKLQQRGASIQQKYLCEKVFDLLKAAWNRFNSEER